MAQLEQPGMGLEHDDFVSPPFQSSSNRVPVVFHLYIFYHHLSSF